MKIKLLMFDLDGTLLNTIDDIANSMNNVLSANLYPSHSVSWYIDRVGNGSKKLLLDALPADHGLCEKRIKNLWDVYREEYRLNCAVLTKPYDGIPELLYSLAGSSMHIVVATNKPQNITEILLTTYFKGIEFLSVYGEKPGRPLKPDPYVAQEILSTSGVSQEQAIIVGDSEVDMVFAKKASIFSIGVLWGFRNRNILEEYGAGAIVERPAQIEEYLKVKSNE